MDAFGDGASGVGLIEEIYRVLLVYAKRLLGFDPHVGIEAVDLVQETATVLLGQIDRLYSMSPDDFIAWAISIERNLWRNLRRRQRSLALPRLFSELSDGRLVDELESSAYSADRAVARDESERAIAALLRSLGRREALVLRLHYWEGLSMAGIARLLGASKSSIVREKRASITKLRRSLRLSARAARASPLGPGVRT